MNWYSCNGNRFICVNVFCCSIFFKLMVKVSVSLFALRDHGCKVRSHKCSIDPTFTTCEPPIYSMLSNEWILNHSVIKKITHFSLVSDCIFSYFVIFANFFITIQLKLFFSFYQLLSLLIFLKYLDSKLKVHWTSLLETILETAAVLL